MTAILRCSVLALALASLAGPAHAQYFGRNKVQYETFDFKVLTTEHFRVYFYPAEREAAEQAARMAERWYARLSTLLKHQLRGKQALVLYADHPDFEQTNVITDQPNEATGGVTESLKRRIILPLGASLAETDHVLGHELVHAFQYDITGVGGGGSAMAPGVSRLPLWFVEGMAEYLSIGPVDPHTTMWMRDAARRDKLPKFSELASYKYFPYRYGQAFWSYVGGTYGDDAVARALRVGGKVGDPRIAIQQVTGRPPDSLVADWHRALKSAAVAVSEVADSGVPAARRLAGGEDDGGQLNLAPAVSPDGSRIAFLSEVGLFSIDLYLAPTDSGAGPLRKLFSSTRDPEYESLQFINSAGGWDMAGQRFAFGAVARGRPILTIVDAGTGAVEREIPLPEVGEIFNPTWSPDGRAIAFSALVGGLTDLFVYDLEARSTRRLTEDAFADLQPAWSPNGGEIAFVTDRFGTSLGNLSYGSYRLALIDVASGRIRALPTLGEAKHINPQWSPDGNSLYLLSDRGGVTNVYRLSLADGEFTQVTNLYTGVSGISALSPALSVAQKSGAVVFGVYADGGYELYEVDDPAVLAGRPLRALPPGAAVLPPQRRVESSTIVATLDNPREGLPADTGWVASPYRAGVSLDFIAQPSLAVAADRFGTYIGGGATLYWSDMLGDHNLVTMVQTSGSFDFLNVAALVGYENRTSRWNWGAAIQQIPYLYGGILAYYDNTTYGTPAYVEQIRIQRQINRQAVGFVAYPFNRSQRVEFQAGIQYIAFDSLVETRAYSRVTGQLLDDSRVSGRLADPLTLGTATAALVYDNSLFGATSPLIGQRYRLELSPVVGSLMFTTALADYRRYITPVRPFTLAGRIMHIGRYGPDADDAVIFPLFLGYPSLVRGYDFNSFEGDECPTTTPDCPVIDQLFGSKLVVANAELRFPLLGLLGLGDGYYGFLPIEAALFYDAGVTWTGFEGTRLLSNGPRELVTSAGITLRMNLFGYAIGQLDYVRPFQRPQRDWMIRLSLTPGF